MRTDEGLVFIHMEVPKIQKNIHHSCSLRGSVVRAQEELGREMHVPEGSACCLLRIGGSTVDNSLVILVVFVGH